jgi:hypothetical protein
LGQLSKEAIRHISTYDITSIANNSNIELSCFETILETNNKPLTFGLQCWLNFKSSLFEMLSAALQADFRFLAFVHIINSFSKGLTFGLKNVDFQHSSKPYCFKQGSRQLKLYLMQSFYR